MEEQQRVEVRMETVFAMSDLQSAYVTEQAESVTKLHTGFSLPEPLPCVHHLVEDLVHVIAETMRDREREKENLEAEHLRLLDRLGDFMPTPFADLGGL